jgi:hypothetical protein
MGAAVQNTQLKALQIGPSHICFAVGAVLNDLTASLALNFTQGIACCSMLTNISAAAGQLRHSDA